MTAPMPIGTRLEPRIARLPLLSARVERGEYGIEQTEGLLLARERVAALTPRVGLADSPQLPGLHAIGERMPAHPPRFAAFLQRRVVQIAVIREQPRRAPLLRAGRIGAELERASHRARPSRHGRSSCVPLYRDNRVGRRGNPAQSRRELNPLNWLVVREGESDG